MGRGPAITQEEIKEAHRLKGEKMKVQEIARKMGRSVPTIYKMLAALPPTSFEAVTS